jgi:hypothetical protein
MIAVMAPGGMEAVGDAVTGGLVARALEPAAGEHEGKGEGLCLNCGTALIGPHCHQCGQPAHVHRTVSAWWHDLAHGVLHLDGKIWRTLPLLAWRPGELTRRYIRGERAKFVSPLALFLFSVFLMFAMFSAFGEGISIDPTGVARGLAHDVQVREAAITRMEAERAALAAGHKPTADIDSRLKQAGEQLALVRTMDRRGLVQGSVVRVSDDAPSWLREPMKKAGHNPSLMLYKLQSNAYKFSWALIPISVPFLWLLFLHRGRYRREYRAYDHLVFVTYSIAAMSLALVLLTLVREIGMPSAIVAILTLAVPPTHIYRQLRGAYQVTWFGAAWRTAALLFFATCALALFLVMLVALGVFG